MNLYVSNLGFSVNNDDLLSLFSQYGQVSSAKVITDKITGRSRGFAFVEMSDEDGNKAIKDLGGKVIDGRAMSVAVAKPKSENSFSGNSGRRW
jgi:RNA recognition motif-containing protein